MILQELGTKNVSILLFTQSKNEAQMRQQNSFFLKRKMDAFLRQS